MGWSAPCSGRRDPSSSMSWRPEILAAGSWGPSRPTHCTLTPRTSDVKEEWPAAFNVASPARPVVGCQLPSPQRNSTSVSLAPGEPSRKCRRMPHVLGSALAEFWEATGAPDCRSSRLAFFIAPSAGFAGASRPLGPLERGATAAIAPRPLGCPAGGQVRPGQGWVTGANLRAQFWSGARALSLPATGQP